jgi:signal transduction protein with GAF and PtsI domain
MTIVDAEPIESETKTDAEWVYEIGNHIAAGHALDETLVTTVDLARARVNCDACLIYIHNGARLVPWVARHRVQEAVGQLRPPPTKRCVAFLTRHRLPIAISRDGSREHGTHSRFRPFPRWSTDPGETFIAVPLVAREQLVGVLSLQHCQPRRYRLQEVKLLSTIGFLIGTEIAISGLESRNSRLLLQLETRKVLERGKSILQRDLGLSEEQAYLALQRQSRQRRKSMKEIAQAVILRDKSKRGAPTDASLVWRKSNPSSTTPLEDR